MYYNNEHYVAQDPLCLTYQKGIILISDKVFFMRISQNFSVEVNNMFWLVRH